MISLNLYAIFFPAIDDEVENINMAFPTPAKIARDERFLPQLSHRVT